jgi:hypothetical protein
MHWKVAQHESKNLFQKELRIPLRTVVRVICVDELASGGDYHIAGVQSCEVLS